MIQGSRTISRPATSVARQLIAEIVGDFQIDAVERVSLRGLLGNLLLGRELRRPPRWLRRRSAGARFRHLPDVVDRNAEPFETLDHAWRGRRSCNRNAFQRAGAVSLLFE